LSTLKTVKEDYTDICSRQGVPIGGYLFTGLKKDKKYTLYTGGTSTGSVSDGLYTNGAYKNEQK
jgi:hypothetical protein